MGNTCDWHTLCSIFNLKATPQVNGRAAASFGMGGGMHDGMGRGRAYDDMHSNGRYGGPSDDMGRQESMRRNYERETERLRNEMNATREELNREMANENPDDERVNRLRCDLSDMSGQMDRMHEEYRRQMRSRSESYQSVPGSE
jgi:hypothetical protein